MTAKWQYKSAYEAAIESLTSLRAENAILRELVARIARYKFYPCDGCMHREWCDSHPIDLLTPRAWCPEQVDIENECKRLGIEVH